MSHRDFFIERFRAERPAFVNVLRAMPTDRLDYKPHERNGSAADIAWFLVLELRRLVELLEKGETQWEQSPNPHTTEAIAAAYEAAADDMQRVLAATGDAEWERDGSMFYNGKLMLKRPAGETIWNFFFDAIHHRGQLTVYLRPMGGKVPSTYGPTADTKG
jgi:uncharacterized damage-inducible protein DinB